MSASLEQVAKRVGWYSDPARLLANPDLFLARVMARGGSEDVVEVLRHFPIDALRRAYLHAPPGLFTKRAWAYWGLVLVNDAARPMPERFPGANRLDWRKAT